MQNSASGKFLPRLTFQTLLIMRMLSVFILAASLQVHARISAQTVTYSVKNASIDKVFKEIKRQTGYGFMYNNHILEIAKPVSLDVTNKAFKEVLDDCFRNQPFTYEIDNKTVIVKEKVETVKMIAPEVMAPLPVDVKGRVIDSTGAPLVGAGIKVKGTNISTVSDENGEYSLKGIANDATLVVSFVGYGTREVKVNNQATVGVMLRMTDKELAEVAIQSYSNGYQQIPRERATGSFDFIDNKTYNRGISNDILSRLDGIANGLFFNTNGAYSGTNPIYIRGTSSLTLSSQPLIIVDNFPYTGDYKNINPNDIETVTVLKDAAAASIWGSQAGNGVIVFTTKKGKYNQNFSMNFSSNTSVLGRPDLFSNTNRMSSNDFINVEQFLFGKGFYDADLNSANYRMISPVVRILANQRQGTISASDATKQIDAYRNLDNRSQLQKYMYDPQINQQYSLSMSGGSSTINYLISGGVNNMNNGGNNSGNRNTLQTIHSTANFKPVKSLEISVGLDYSHSIQKVSYVGMSSPGGGKGMYYPYAMIADDNGTSLAVPRDYAQYFKDTAGAGKLLDWNYKPIEERNRGNLSVLGDNYVLSLDLKYTIFRGLSFSVKYLHQSSSTLTKNIKSIDMYETRNQINLYTQRAGNGTFSYAMPLGGTVANSSTGFLKDNGRAQLNYNKAWSDKHQLDASAAFDVSQDISSSFSTPTAYGYNDDILTTIAVNPTLNYRFIDGLGSGRLSGGDVSFSQRKFRYVSYTSNIGYTYNKRYTITASARNDASNLFGANTNNRQIPLWSAGLSWKVSDESFYKSSVLPKLSFRATYGTAGMSSQNTPALATIRYGSSAYFTGLPYADVVTPPNPDLRWEKKGTFNIGADFGFKGNWLSGSIEYFHIKSVDLLAQTPADLTTGYNFLNRNSANLIGDGIDVTLNFRVVDKQFAWTSTIFFNYVKNKVTKYLRAPLSPGSYVGGGISIGIPFEGRDPYGMYAYKFAGLDPSTGDPQGYINKQISKNYTQLLAPASFDDLVDMGTGRPPVFGAFINTLSWKGFSLTGNISYRFGFSFFKNTISYDALFNSWYQQAEFSKRWQKPGDELITTVPSMIYPNNSNRDQFYARSEANVIKGDVIKLQDLKLSYDFNPIKIGNYKIRQLSLFLYAKDMGMIWIGNKEKIDPDYPAGMAPQKSFAIGIHAAL